MRNMIIDLSWLLDHPREIQKFHWQLEGENSDLDGELARFQDQVEVDLTLTNEGKYIVGSGTVTTVLGFACGSCLEWYSWPLRVEFPLQLCDEAQNQGLEDEDFIWYHDNQADVSSVVLENIILNLPLRRVCQDPCKGLCPQCGVNRNHEDCDCQEDETDPRWDALKKLL